MYPEVAQYIKTRDEAQSAYNEKRRALHDEMRSLDYDQPRRHAAHDEICALYPNFEVTRNEAWQQLKSSGDPLVRFIADNCKEYQDYAAVILQALPADLETLEDLADDDGWCHIWGQFRDRAVVAGLFSDATKANMARRAVLVWLNDNYEMDRENVKHLTRLMDAAIAAAIAEAQAEPTPAEAPASV